VNTENSTGKADAPSLLERLLGGFERIFLKELREEGRHSFCIEQDEMRNGPYGGERTALLSGQKAEWHMYKNTGSVCHVCVHSSSFCSCQKTFPSPSLRVIRRIEKEGMKGG